MAWCLVKYRDNCTFTLHLPKCSNHKYNKKLKLVAIIYKIKMAKYMNWLQKTVWNMTDLGIWGNFNAKRFCCLPLEIKCNNNSLKAVWAGAWYSQIWINLFRWTSRRDETYILTIWLYIESKKVKESNITRKTDRKLVHYSELWLT
jgi:hypothetical protein